jgi:hypothetical protein
MDMFRTVSLSKIVIGEMRCKQESTACQSQLHVYGTRSHGRQSRATPYYISHPTSGPSFVAAAVKETGAKCFNRILSLLSLVPPSLSSLQPSTFFSRLVDRWVFVPLRRSIPILTAVSNLESRLAPHPWPISNKALNSS